MPTIELSHITTCKDIENNQSNHLILEEGSPVRPKYRLFHITLRNMYVMLRRVSFS